MPARRSRPWPLALLALLSAGWTSGAAGASADPAPGVLWHDWSGEAFAQARREHKAVVLDLEAVWCHWCHVMDGTTYRDPSVRALLAGHFIAIRVDQDARPDLSNRYEDYGWPATVVFAADGREIARRRGYLRPAEMASLLQAVVDDPTPGPSAEAGPRAHAAASTGPDPARTAALRGRLLAGYDPEGGGWSRSHKFMDADNAEYCLRAAGRGDLEAAKVALDMLRLQEQLFDRSWGGVYQYSADGDWVHPHFEKIMAVQAANMRVYALAGVQYPQAGFGMRAWAVRRFLKGFLTSPEGGFYTSQDADLVPGRPSDDYFALPDQGRRALGVPRVDRHRYARENGWAIRALCALADATGQPGPLREAQAAAGWVITHRSLPGGGFRHDERDEAGPYLGDSLAMGRAFLALYQSTGYAPWLVRAEGAADFIRGRFALPAGPGFATAAAGPLPAGPQFDESADLARFAALLGQASGRPSDRALAESALGWLMSPEVIGRRGPYVGGALLAEEELDCDPIHVTVVGNRDDPAARALFDAARRIPTAYKLIEWWDRREGPPPRGQSPFPRSDRAAAYLCANGGCSPPIRVPDVLNWRLARALKESGP